MYKDRIKFRALPCRILGLRTFPQIKYIAKRCVVQDILDTLQGQKADGPKKTEEALENVSRFDRAIMPHVYSRLNMKGKQRSSIYIYIHVYTVIASHYNAVTCEHSVGLHPTLSMHKLCCC